MPLVIAAGPIPLAMDEEGVVRVSSTRVTLESLLSHYSQGATAEEIARRYPAVPLPDVYAVIAYYLRHRNDVEEYLAQSRFQLEEGRRRYASELDPHRLRERLPAQKGRPSTISC